MIDRAREGSAPTDVYPTVGSVGREAAGRLHEAGFAMADAARDAGVLARAWLDWDHARWLTETERPATPEFVTGLASWVQRRAAREPVAYIVGEREFYGRLFHVTPAVLIPRPETELVVDAALASLRSPGTRSSAAAHVLDVGTGSGCLAVTLALEDPALAVTATDVSDDALAVARTNARRHKVAGRIEFVAAALTGPGPAVYDVIVSNPPYVAEDGREALPPDVRDYEPPAAIFGGADGLDVMRALAPAARAALRPRGRLVMEIGQGQAARVEALLVTSGLRLVDARSDLAGIWRVVVAARADEPV